MVLHLFSDLCLAAKFSMTEANYRFVGWLQLLCMGYPYTFLASS